MAMNRVGEKHSGQRHNRSLLLLITLAAFLLRSLWVDWQPLWWDEGYSVYFATEPLARMVWLTAHDIHPPLYYAILHLWTQAVGGVSPVVVRSLSIVIGALTVPLMWWLGRVFFPSRPRVAWIAALLMLVNPLHLYYSQEARMYGLATALGMFSTACLWLSMERLTKGERALGTLAGYAIATILALYTLYYMALLLFAQAIWTIWTLRQRWRILRWLLLAWLAAGLTFLPWFLYAGPKLSSYVVQKVAADRDQPLALAEYLWRHLAAFTTGHFPADSPLLTSLGFSGVLGMALLALFTMRKIVADRNSHRTQKNGQVTVSPLHALWSLVLIPATCAFLLNLQLPFFPDGGERLLLFIWPYLFLLAAYGVDDLGEIGLAAFILLGIAAFTGVFAFFTTPRFVEQDYRPLIRQVVQQGADDDSLLAIFPWLVGYWRAYAPPGLPGPQPLLLGEGAVEYGPQVESALQNALSQGRIWFPEPLSFGSVLPHQIEAFLANHGVNLENRWYSDDLRLTAWAPAPAPEAQKMDADFGVARLVAGGVAGAPVFSANDTITVTLVWETGAPTSTLAVALRLLDQRGTISWASRDYAPLGSLGVRSGRVITEHVALNIPVGLTPGIYELGVGLLENGQSRTTNMGDARDLLFAPLGEIEIIQPQQPQPPERLPIAVQLEQPPVIDGVAWLGYSLPSTPILSGTELAVTLFFESRMASPSERSVFIALLNQDGEGVAGWQGWPLPLYPTSVWPDGALVQTPVRFFLPATLASGRYRVAAGWVDERSGVKSVPVALGDVEIVQRPASFTPQTPPIHLNPAPLLGSHASLVGYGVEEVGETIALTLYWEIKQPLLPPHHIFVHADDATGATLAQADGSPMTPTSEAPTGSWLPGEHLTTLHHLPRPGANWVLRVGLYEPQSGVRLPVTTGGAAQGDAVLLAPPR